MVSRKELLKNLQNYSAEEIAEAVRAGKVTLYELSKGSGGAFTPLLKKNVQLVLESSAPNKSLQQKMATNTEVSSNMPEEGSTAVSLSGGSSDEAVVNQQSPANDTLNSDSGNMFQNVFSFKGRIRRMEFVISFLLYLLYDTGVCVVYIANPRMGEELWGFLLCTMVPATWFYCAQFCKRLHDRGLPGYRIVLLLVPLYNVYVLGKQFFEEGQKRDNNYGKNPKD